MATRPDSPVPLLDEDPYNGLSVRILRLGPEFSYRVPSFSVLTVDLRQATMQIETVDSDGETTVQCTDGFIRSDAQLDRIICPFLLTLSNSCLVPVEEFNKVVYINHLRTVEPDNLLIAWEGEIEQVVESGSSDDSSNDSDPPPSPSDDSITDDASDLSMVTFKVIGVLSDPDIQTRLREIRDRQDRGEQFCVKLLPEPDNPVDPWAIRFGINIDDSWMTIGYVVKEILEEVHSAIRTNSILNTELAWVKYKLWKKAPGFYAAVNITRIGQWSLSVYRARSTFS